MAGRLIETGIMRFTVRKKPQMVQGTLPEQYSAVRAPMIGQAETVAELAKMWNAKRDPDTKTELVGVEFLGERP